MGCLFGCASYVASQPDTVLPIQAPLAFCIGF